MKVTRYLVLMMSSYMSSVAWAGGSAAPIPEPDMFSLVMIGAIAGLLVMIGRRKK